MNARPESAVAKQGLVVALNCGSSSIKCAVFEADVQPLPRVPSWTARVEGIGGNSSTYQEHHAAPVPLALDAAHAWHRALERVREGFSGRLMGRRIRLIVHRVVHGGARYLEPVRLDAGVLAGLEQCIPLAPLHQPHALEAIRIMLETEPGVPQVACFDTAFHSTLPEVEQALPLPYELRRQGLRRYGFHGLSYEYLAAVLAERYGDAARGRTIAAHLGSGASLCAMQNLKSCATTMGFSALDGLMMGTRSGALDPGVLLHLLQVEQCTPEELSRMLYHESGLLGVSGISAEPRVIAAHMNDAGERGARARLALKLYVHRIVRETGALAAVLGGLDMLVFTAGVGEHSALVRERVCASLGWLGVTLDAAANQRNAAVISCDDSRVLVAVEPTNEEWITAIHGLACLARSVSQPAGSAKEHR